MQPRYPQIQVRTHSRNPLTLIAAVREELRRRRAGREEIHRFSRQAFAAADPQQMRAVCRRWVEVRPERR